MTVVEIGVTRQEEEGQERGRTKERAKEPTAKDFLVEPDLTRGKTGGHIALTQEGGKTFQALVTNSERSEEEEQNPGHHKKRNGRPAFEPDRTAHTVNETLDLNDPKILEAIKAGKMSSGSLVQSAGELSRALGNLREAPPTGPMDSRIGLRDKLVAADIMLAAIKARLAMIGASTNNAGANAEREHLSRAEESLKKQMENLAQGVG